MALKDEGSSITVKGMRAMIDFGATDNTTSPSEVVYVPLKPTKILLGLRELVRLVP